MTLEMKIVKGETLGSLKEFGEYNDRVTKVTINNCPNVTNIYQMCNGMNSLEELIIDDKSILVIEDMDYAFRYTTSLLDSSLDFLTTREINTGSLRYTFAGTSANVPVFDTSNITNLDYAFEGTSATTIASGWNFDNVLTANNSFYNSSIVSFPVINFPKCTSFSQTWSYCYSLTSFPAIDVSKGESFYRAWYSTSAMQTFPTEPNGDCSLDFTNGKSFSSAFSRSGLVDAPRFRFLNPAGALCSYMFGDCTSLVTHRGFTLDSVVERYVATYDDCINLTCVGDLPVAITLGDFGACFRGCSALTTIKHINTTGGAHTNDDMFDGCVSLTSPNASEQNAISSTGGTVYTSGIDCPTLPPPP